MEKQTVYDWPTRVFHWLFAGLFIGAFFIAKTVDDESSVYPYHMLLGLTLAAAVVLRVIWGLIGSRYARFSSFALKPIDLVNYLRSMLSTGARRQLGHNPASSWAALIMMGLALGLAVTGVLMSQDINKEVVEEVHEIFANTFAVVVIAHIVGVLFHTIKHKDAIGMSMIHGKKNLMEGQIGIQQTYPAVGLLFLALIGAFVFQLNQNYNPSTQRLSFFGATLQLGEFEGESEAGHEGGESDDDGDDD